MLIFPFPWEAIRLISLHGTNHCDAEYNLVGASHERPSIPLLLTMIDTLTIIFAYARGQLLAICTQ